jgi:hypothetical protein
MTFRSVVNKIRKLKRTKEWLQERWTGVLNFLFTTIFFLLLIFASGIILTVSKGFLTLSLCAITALCLGLVFQLRFRKRPASEIDIADYRKDIAKLEQELEQTKRKKPVVFSYGNLLKMDWIWEINVAEVTQEKFDVCDNYMSKQNLTPIPWQESSQGDHKKGDHRMIGVLKTRFNVKAGTNLRSLLVEPNGAVLKCSKPIVSNNGVSNIKTEWLTQVDLKRGFNGRWAVNESPNIANDHWESVYRDATESASNADSFEPGLLKIIQEEIKTRLQAMLGDIQVEFIDRELLSKPVQIGTYFNNLNTTPQPQQLVSNTSADGNS